jgi:hypothetical protein
MGETQEMNILQKFAQWWMRGKQSQYLVWVLMLVLIVFPIFNPLALPIGVNTWTYDYYNAIESVPDGGIALYTIDFGPGDVDSTLAWVTGLKHLARKNMDIIIFNIWSPIANTFGDTLLKKADLEGDYGYVYGEDIVYLGWLVGEEVVLAAIYSDFKGTIKADYYGADASTLPLIQRVNDHNDVDIMIVYQAYGHIGPMYARQWPSEPGRPTVGGLGVEYYPDISLGYWANAAQYEVLTGIAGEASRATDIRSLTQIFQLSVILIGNLAYRIRGRKTTTRTDTSIFE